jgi:site-specific DNA-methyltransferase (adenine-specific)
MNRVVFRSASDNWSTPKDVYESLDNEFSFDYDPCPLLDQPLFDGLTTDWGSVNFVNPPYSQIKAWCKKAYDEWKNGKTVIMLIPSRTDTAYWHDYIMKATEIRFIKGRLKFGGAKYNAPFPSAIIVFK